MAGDFYACGGNQGCMSCGLPEHVAPDLLAKWDDTNTAAETFFVKQPASADEVERACDAIEVCCIGALRYGGTDPRIIARISRDKPDCCDHRPARPGGAGG